MTATPAIADRAAWQAEIDELVFAQGPYEETSRYRKFRGWEMPWYSWPQGFLVDGSNTRTNGRPTAQWSRLEAERSDDLTQRRDR